MSATLEHQLPEGKGTRLLTQEDLYGLFPNHIISKVKKMEYVEMRPRAGVTYSEITVRSASGEEPAHVRRFGNIALSPEEARDLGLEEGVLTVDYLGGDHDNRMLTRLLELLGEPKEPQHWGYKVFTQPISVGLFGADKRNDYDRDNERYTQTPQREVFERVVGQSEKPILVIMAHGGAVENELGEVEKTIGSQDGATTASLEIYLDTINVGDFSAILDMSCTLTPDYCVQSLPKYLPDNCPPYFGCLEENDRSLGINPVDTYYIIDRESKVFPKAQ